METIKKQLNFTDVMVDKIEEIQAKHGLLSFTAAIHYCVVQTHRGDFKDYVVTKQAASKSESEKMEEKETAQDARDQKEYDKKAVICGALAGEVKKKDGVNICVYYDYNRTRRYEQEMPFKELSETLVSKQYIPSKEAIEKLQKAGKTKY